VILADWAAIAIENARLYEAVNARRKELERAVRGFEATATIARAVGRETDLGRVLELIVKRGRALVEARSVLILLRQGDELAVASAAGHVSDREPVRLPAGGSFIGDALERQRTLVVADVERELALQPEQLGVPDASTALVVPLVFRGRALGALIAFDRLSGEGSFSRDDEQVLQAFAASAATAVANTQSVEADRLRHSLRAADEERRRWARELHDETLQGLGGLKMVLNGAARRDDPEQMRAAIGEAVEHVAREIENLRAIIADLRPAALDDLGLGPALETLLARTASAHGLEVRGEVSLPEARLAPDLESVVYRVVQEALTNVAKHARATTVTVEVRDVDERLVVRVADDGVGVTDGPSGGYGLVGMQERVGLAGGELDVSPGRPGTVVRATLPLAFAEYGNLA
jgi:signal transduction histidine kinase